MQLLHRNKIQLQFNRIISVVITDQLIDIQFTYIATSPVYSRNAFNIPTSVQNKFGKFHGIAFIHIIRTETNFLQVFQERIWIQSTENLWRSTAWCCTLYTNANKANGWTSREHKMLLHELQLIVTPQCGTDGRADQKCGRHKRTVRIHLVTFN